MQSILEIAGLTKTYRGGFTALNGVDLTINKGEIFALLGPNGAGKTTLIGAVCGLVEPSAGSITAFGKDMKHHWRSLRARIGLVPQELTTDMFETVWRTVNYSRGLFGLAPDKGKVEAILRSLSLWDKRDNQVRALSGGMKRRVMIAKALAHEPELLFLDEPTAGVDVELRRDMWENIARLRDGGTTIILTTHYIEEAEEMADRIGIIQSGRIRMVDETQRIMRQLGRIEADFALVDPLPALPPELAQPGLSLSADGATIHFRDAEGAGGSGGEGKAHVAAIAQKLAGLGYVYRSIDMRRSSLEDIFVHLLGEPQS
ncbi:ABC transporter ATP-binding protein [Novosphingobium colocasiae]